MKEIIFLIFLCYTSVIYCQPEFSPIGSEWTYELSYEQFHPPFNVYYDHYKIRITKDTIINGRVYKIANRNSVKNFFDFADKENMFIRQEKGTIYILLDKEYVLYNFDANANEIVNSTAYSKLHGIYRNFETKIESIEIDTINGTFYKIQKASFPCFPSTDTIYLHQKYGCISHSVDVFFPEDLCSIDPLYSIKLRCYKEGDILIKNFDSIPCDSLRPDIINTSIKVSKFENIKIFQDHESLFIINNSTEVINNISLFGLSGNLFFKQKAQNFNSNFQISKDQIQPGLYFVNLLFYSGTSITKKILIE